MPKLPKPSPFTMGLGKYLNDMGKGLGKYLNIIKCLNTKIPKYLKIKYNICVICVLKGENKWRSH